MKKTVKIIMIMIATFIVTVSICVAGPVVTEGKRVYIVDRTGDRWDVTKEEELGFIPQNFQYCIGKMLLSPFGMRILKTNESQGFSIPELLVYRLTTMLMLMR